MKIKQSIVIRFGVFILSLILAASLQAVVHAQAITVYQYRHVPAENVNEFLERETKYWAAVAENSVKKGNLTFWALLEKMGGYDLPNSSNFLFVNTFNDIDDVSSFFDMSEALPGMKWEDIETESLSTTTTMLFVNVENWQQAADAQSDDFNYLNMIYHNASDPQALIQLENDHWGPFIKEAMDSKKTTQTGWGNASIISPTGEDILFNTISYDIYPSLKEALIPTWDENMELPDEGMAKIMELEQNRRSSVIYRIVKVVQAPQ